jgi:hypothetical protein
MATDDKSKSAEQPSPTDAAGSGEAEARKLMAEFPDDRETAEASDTDDHSYGETPDDDRHRGSAEA